MTDRSDDRNSYAYKFFKALDVDDRDPIPMEVTALTLLIEVKLPALHQLLTRIAGETEKRIPDPDLWAFLDAAHKQLKLAEHYAKMRLEYWKVREDKKDAEEKKAWAEQNRKTLMRWFADNE